MKRTIALLVTISASLLLLVGCSSGSNGGNNSLYNKAMDNGNSAVNKKNYSEALAYFTSANDAKSDKEASASKEQAKNLVAAKNSMDKHDLDTAKDQLNDVRNQSNGNSAMNDRAKDMLKQVKKIKSNRSDLNKSVKNASDMIDNGDNAAGMSLLKTVLNFKGINGKYYSDIYKKAVDLLQNSSSGSSQSSTTNSSDSSSSNSSDSTKASTSSDSDNPAAKGDFDIESRKSNGKTITDSDISKARQDLTDQGVKNVAAWSDNDIVKAIKNAQKDGRTTIKASDIRNQ
ncbi:hypothetical protein [Companilactobacillus sp.]|jgi:hypothetical protein|uniref:hypothetical protein n=1 Tax=Companilactobacillus sp. TaxID=2767905 RepID=UPI0025C51E9E|nr:hypothetical protein [Companilactobacillus sp.]MCH4009921.1 hypothetical protein [Companilactobacillus sp.]MCH4052403.1 hypothetical protein [Companilactobacillus sp.]MCH4077863.1 hypothetical protein [Companilactobacillus sp.]MCH4126439.1 hypothetical protein [Companilactobacillus sp.]MCH4132025.1 hypothetical protein [Companilactobacillus sp.]